MRKAGEVQMTADKDLWKIRCINKPSTHALEAYWRLCVDIARRGLQSNEPLTTDDNTNKINKPVPR